MLLSPMMRTPIVLAFLLCGPIACSPTQELDTAPADTAAVPTGHWDETNTQTVADEMIGDMLQEKWLRQWTEDHDGRPTVFIGRIRNRTIHIDRDTLYYHLNQKLRQANIQAAPDIARKIRKEVLSKPRAQRDMKPWIRDEEIVSKSQENGADFVILGTISSTIPENQSGNTVSIFYTVTLELENVESSVKVWLQEKEIKKTVKRSKVNR